MWILPEIRHSLDLNQEFPKCLIWGHPLSILWQENQLVLDRSVEAVSDNLNSRVNQ